MMDMAKLTTLVNPINSLQANSYSKVTQASAKEYSDGWGTYCSCFEKPSMETDNPYVLGVKGNYRLKTSLLYLTPRDQSSFDNNTNIRKDGTFNSYNPFYSDSSGYWKMTPSNWTYTSEVTNFNPYGQEIEDVDALGRYSSATFGYNQTLPTSVAANSQYKEQGFDSFEDYAFAGCADNHLDVNRSAITLDATQAHTGRHSLLVGNTPVVIGGQITTCAPYNPCNISLCYSLSTTPTSVDTLIFRPTGGTAPYTFSWSGANLFIGPDGNPRLLDNASVPYSFSINVTDSKGCTYKTAITAHGQAITGASQCSPCTVSLCYTTGTANGFPQITVQPVGGTPPYTLTGSNTLVGQFETVVVGTNDVVVTYGQVASFTVTVTDNNGCTFTVDFSTTGNRYTTTPAISSCN